METHSNTKRPLTTCVTCEAGPLSCVWGELRVMLRRVFIITSRVTPPHTCISLSEVMRAIQTQTARLASYLFTEHMSTDRLYETITWTASFSDAHLCGTKFLIRNGTGARCVPTYLFTCVQL